MASTTFVDYSQNTPIVAAWLNDVNNAVYNADGSVNKAQQTPVAWVRFNGAAGVIVSSFNITSLLKTGTGSYRITYSVTLPIATNCYSITTNQAGFNTVAAETTVSVDVLCANTSNVASDATIVCVQIFASH